MTTTIQCIMQSIYDCTNFRVSQFFLKTFDDLIGHVIVRMCSFSLDVTCKRKQKKKKPSYMFSKKVLTYNKRVL